MPETDLSAARWRKSSRSHNNSQQQCVEVAAVAHAIGVRDSKNPDAGHLTLDRTELAALIDRIKTGDLDL